MTPIVSFVVPCYKLAHLLPECVNSILAQTYEDFEILIMDNCSPDNTPEVAASFNDPRVQHIRNETNLGHVRNFNKGITRARGKYVWLVSTDCGKEDRIWEGPKFLMRLIRGDCIVLSSAMARKECYDKYGLFSLEMPHANDWYLWCVLALHYQVAYLSEPMLFVRIHEESLTSEFNQGGNPICSIDELNALWRVARLAEVGGVISDRRAFNSAIATLAAWALRYGPPGGKRPGLAEADFEALLRSHVRDSKDEEDFRARLFMAIGDEEFWHGHSKEAAKSYWLGLRLRPWWWRTWIKYLLLRTGGVGISVRRFLLGLRHPRAEAR